jgi:hypothetical protein
MASNVHGRPIVQPRGTAGRLRESAGGSAATSTGNAMRPATVQQKSAEQNFEERQRQWRAATILESNEMLVWAGMEMCEVNFCLRLLFTLLFFRSFSQRDF